MINQPRNIARCSGRSYKGCRSCLLYQTYSSTSDKRDRLTSELLGGLDCISYVLGEHSSNNYVSTGEEQ